MNTQTTNQPLSVAEAKNALRNGIARQREFQERVAAKKKKMLAATGGIDLAELAKKDPDRARRVAAEIGGLQSEMMVDQMLADGFDEQVSELAPILIDEVGRMGGEIGRMATANIESVIAHVMGELRRRDLFEEERLRRIALESFPVRAEQGFYGRYHNIGSMAVDSYSGGSDRPDYYVIRDVASVVRAHDAHLAAVEEVKAHTAEVQRRYS